MEWVYNVVTVVGLVVLAILTTILTDDIKRH